MLVICKFAYNLAIIFVFILIFRYLFRNFLNDICSHGHICGTNVRNLKA